jgi:hypothetical protein
MRAQKASGVAQSYPVQPDRAWQIAHAVLDATSAVAIEEHQPEGYLVADTPAFLWGLPTRNYAPKHRHRRAGGDRGPGAATARRAGRWRHHRGRERLRDELARRDRLTAELADLDAAGVADTEVLLRTVSARAADLRALLGRHVTQARQVVSRGKALALPALRRGTSGWVVGPHGR